MLWVTAYNSSFILAYVCIYMVILEPAAKAERQLRESAAAAKDEQARSKGGRGNEKVAADRGESRSEDEDEEDSLTPSLLKSLNTHAFAVFLIVSADSPFDLPLYIPILIQSKIASTRPISSQAPSI